MARLIFFIIAASFLGFGVTVAFDAVGGAVNTAQAQGVNALAYVQTARQQAGLDGQPQSAGQIAQDINNLLP